MTIHYENLSDDDRNTIIDNLLKKFPKGPYGSPLSLSEKYSWCGRNCRIVVKCDDPYWGYDALTLYRLGLHGQSECRNYAADRWNCPRSTATRRANRLWNRIETGVNKIHRDGAAGLWSVRRSYEEITRIWANDHAEAIRIATTFFAAVLGIESGRLNVVFAGLGHPTQMLQYDASRTREVTRKIASYKKQIAEFEQKITKAAQDSEMVSTMLNTIIAEHIIEDDIIEDDDV